MKIIIHTNDRDLPVLALQSWLRQYGYRLVYKTDGSVHAVPNEPLAVATHTDNVVPLRTQVPNPFGGAA